MGRPAKAVSEEYKSEELNKTEIKRLKEGKYKFLNTYIGDKGIYFCNKIYFLSEEEANFFKEDIEI